MLFSPPRIARIAHGRLFIHSEHFARTPFASTAWIHVSKPSRNPTSFYSSKHPDTKLSINSEKAPSKDDPALGML